MMKLWGYLLFLISFFIIISGFFWQSIVQHELQHQIIYSSYGIESKVTYNFWNASKKQIIDLFTFNFNEGADIKNLEPWATTSTTNASNCTETCEALHTEIEITDSQTSTITMALFAIFLLYVIYKEIFVPIIKKKK